MCCMTRKPQLCSLIEIHNVIWSTVCGFMCVSPESAALSVTVIHVCMSVIVGLIVIHQY